MYILYYFVVLISFCEISFVHCYGNIHVRVFEHDKATQPYDKNFDYYYDDGASVRLRCIISNAAYGDGKTCKVFWVDDYGKEHYNITKSQQFQEIPKILTDADDGTNMQCKAVMNEKSTLSLSVHFINKNKTEIKKPTMFWILIVSICGMVGISILILIIWSLLNCFCKKKVEECDTQVIFSEDLDSNQNNQTLESSNPELTEISYNNQSEVLQNGGAENHIEKTEDSDNDRREKYLRPNSLYISVEESRRLGSSKDC